jgi:hypothetical protein
MTIGDNYEPVSNISTIGELNWPSFAGSSWNNGGTINSDASIFRFPSDAECLPDANNKILIGQFTTSGILSGHINLAGLNPDGSAWSESNIPIPQLQISSGVNENQINDLNIYPNPSNDIFNIEFSSLITQNFKIKMTNSLGEVVFIDNIENHSGDYKIKINLKGHSKGIYFLELQADDELVNKKLILQ